MNAEHETPEWLKFVDHTADAGIAVEAPDLVRLFERAAWGMFSVITDVAAARSTETSRISIDALDRVVPEIRQCDNRLRQTTKLFGSLGWIRDQREAGRLNEGGNPVLVEYVKELLREQLERNSCSAKCGTRGKKSYIVAARSQDGEPCLQDIPAFYMNTNVIGTVTEARLPACGPPLGQG